MNKQRNYWGWGYEESPLPAASVEKYKHFFRNAYGIKEFENIIPVPIEDLKLREPRFSLSDDIQSFCSRDKFDRASHTYGKSFRDIWRGLNGIFNNPPDYIAFPKSEEDIEHLYDFAAKSNVSLIPFGGGSSVCGGIEPTISDKYKGVISVDMKHFDQVIEIDKASRSAHIQAGIFGPALEKALKPHGYTLRHFPQSFEFSTLGGWIATRSGGHFATLYTHIDEFVQAVSMVTPNGRMATRRLPGSGAGPSEERLISGSEGILGIITSAWMRLQEIPKYKKTVTVAFPSFEKGAEAARAIAQSGLNPANARLIDAAEAFSNGLGDGQSSVLIVGFESHQREVTYWMKEALSLCKEHDGSWNDKKVEASERNEKADVWKNSFLLAPYLRDECLKLGLVVETFETAITWQQYPEFYKNVKKATLDAVKKHCGAGSVTCRFTHIYPDGPAPYFTVFAKGEKGKQLEQWDAIKDAASKAIIENGGTITHHHAVGKDHRPYYTEQHTPLFGEMLKAAKKSVDPNWLLNPDVLLEVPK